jgi:hypothetical protein
LSGVRSIFSQTLAMPAESCELARPVMEIIYFHRPDTLGDNIREQTSEDRRQILKWEIGILSRLLFGDNVLHQFQVAD